MNQISLIRYTKDLLVILKKSLSKILVLKFHAILLFQIDFNTLYNITFNYHILPVLEQNNFTLLETVGSRKE